MESAKKYAHHRTNLGTLRFSKKMYMRPDNVWSHNAQFMVKLVCDRKRIFSEMP